MVDSFRLAPNDIFIILCTHLLAYSMTDKNVCPTDVLTYSSEILPHHRFHRLRRPPVVLRARLLIIGDGHLSVDFKVDELSDRHPRVDPHGLADGYLERPCIAEPDVSFSCRGMDVDAGPADAAFPFQERDMPVCLGILLRDPKVQLARDKNQSLLRNPKVVDFIVHQI